MSHLTASVLPYFYPRSPRGERLLSRAQLARQIAISIHAPREGSDQPFQLALPIPLLISIHAPREGSDGFLCGHVVISAISIHAPREGSDSSGTRHATPAG